MGHGTVISNVWDSFTGLFKKTPQAPTAISPDALSSTPTEAQAAASSASTTLSSEQTAASTSTILSGGQGLEDEPTTTSQILHGS